jgi:uncharacterized UBP type Zn finger protein
MIIERDQKIKKMQADLFGQLSEIVSNFEPKEERRLENNVQFVDMESAIKELLAMGVK